jgi:hypothetical protein
MRTKTIDSKYYTSSDGFKMTKTWRDQKWPRLTVIDLKMVICD